MSLEADFVLRALLGHNFLPVQSRDKEEMPPIFASTTFTPDVARNLVNNISRVGGLGYDSVEYKLTRFNGVPRICSILHPVSYAQLALCIHKNWDKLEYITENQNSLITPREHSDGRICSMGGYDRPLLNSERVLNMSFGKRFIAHSDISNFYPSIYSHAIPWALVGFSHAKRNRSNGRWFNQLDEKVRLTKRNETNGVAIGPATSNIMAEAILARIDEKLSPKFEYVRFMDDYTAYCNTEDKAQDFIFQLSRELAKYHLLLNINKSRVVPLPRALDDDWKARTSLSLPKGSSVSANQAVDFLNLAVGLAQQSPDGSVLKYALKTLTGRHPKFINESAICRFALHLAFHQPILVPLLEEFLDARILPMPPQAYEEELKGLTLKNSQLNRSDAVSWMLYYQNKYSIEVEDNSAKEILESRDCVPLLLLYLSGNPNHQSLVINFANSLDNTDLYELDRYWLLRYQLYLDGHINNSVPEETKTFKVLADASVTFIAPTPP